jgi:DNA-binding response OmpR family regulator
MTGRRHILVIDDDADLRASLRRPFAAAGCSVSEAGSLAAASAAIAAPDARFDLILLDRTLPDGDGLALCRALRGQGMTVPIIVLSGLADEDEVVGGLDAGANDYVRKPFRLCELLARMRVQMRVHDISEDAELEVGRFRFRPGDRLLLRPDGERVRLTGKEAAVLKYLCRANGPVSRETLLRNVWGYSANATTHTVETHIYRLRLKLEADPAERRMLVNEAGAYRLWRAGVDDAEEDADPQRESLPAAAA